ncbi:phosphotransferase [Nocardiopsis rhodophaea]
MKRLTWAHLPDPARSAFEAEFGQVLTTSTTPPGLTVGIASRVETERRTVFVKALPAVSPAFPDLDRERIVGEALPESLPAPRLRWSSTNGWLVLAFDYVRGRRVDLTRDSAAVMTSLMAVSRLLRSSPLPSLRPISEKIGALMEGAHAAVDSRPEQIADVDVYKAVLEKADLTSFEGDSLLHADPALSNLIFDGSQVLFVDWALASNGAAWIDTGLLIPALIESGFTPPEAEKWAAQHPAWSLAPPDTLDVLSVIRPLFILNKIQAGPDWLAERRRATLAAHEAWARHRLKLPAVWPG